VRQLLDRADLDGPDAPGGNLEATPHASFMSRASMRKNPPICSLAL
jgi:hypothetical protein